VKTHEVVSDVDAETASTGLELEADHWQWKEATTVCRYTQALELRAQHAEEAIGHLTPQRMPPGV
jgi:hypothetical protein